MDKITLKNLMTDKLPVDHAFPSIIEIHLYNFNDEYPAIGQSWDILREIYSYVLHRDPVWHFFFEGYDSILRVSSEFIEHVKEILDSHDIIYSVDGQWKDEQKGTAKYHRVFTYLFHGFSELAMLMPDENVSDEFYYVTDRIFHSYLNHQWYKLEDHRGSRGEYKWEGALMMSHGLSRIEHNYEIIKPQADIAKARL